MSAIVRSSSTYVRRAVVAVLAAAALLVAAPAAASAMTLPKGFEAQPMVTGLNQATGVAWAPDGRTFVIEKPGRLKVVAPGATTATTVLDISDHVNEYLDRGVLGIALDRDFATNGYVYLLYTYEVYPANWDWWGPTVSRLVRVQVTADSKLVNPDDPETILLGSYGAGPCPEASPLLDCLPSDGTSHSIGTVRTAPDGSLFVGIGDGADFGKVDELALRSYDEDSYAGKILHIDRNGKGLPGHSFCPGDTNYSKVCTKIYAKGFRNPFRFQLRPEGGLTLGDVGWNTWEELDLIDTPGGDYGWPCREAHTQTPGYSDLDACKDYESDGRGGQSRQPAWKYQHQGPNGSAIIGGPTYTGSAYPAKYKGSMFVGDYGQAYVKRVVLNGSGQVTGLEDFATDWYGTSLELAPDGNLVSVNFGTGTSNDASIDKIVYTPANSTPTAAISADQTSGPAPLTVKFSGAGSKDPDGDQLQYSWTFGDDATATGVTASHTYTKAGTFTATLKVSDGRGGSASKSLQINPGGSPPSVEILAPANDSSYQDGQVVQLSGKSMDAQDGTLTGASLVWVVRLIHNTHYHQLANETGTKATFDAARDHDADSHYEITLTATDSDGQTAARTIEIDPETVPLQIASVPAGAPVTYGGRAFTAPTSFQTAVGFDTTITAATRFSIGARRFQFDSWSDGGWLVHTVRVPDAASSLTASYVEDFAAGATASASSEAGADIAANALDDKSFTRWSSAPGQGQWWQVDLGSGRSIDQVDVDWQAAYASKYRILTSLDGVEFAEVEQDTATGAGTRSTSFALLGARYVRVESLTAAAISASDVRVLGPIDGPIVTPETPRDATPPIIPPIDATPPPGYRPPPRDTKPPVIVAPEVAKGKKGRRSLTLRLSERGTVTARLTRRVKGRWRSVSVLTKRVPTPGDVRVLLPKGLREGSYRLVVTATDRASNATKKRVRVYFRV